MQRSQQFELSWCLNCRQKAGERESNPEKCPVAADFCCRNVEQDQSKKKKKNAKKLTIRIGADTGSQAVFMLNTKRRKGRCCLDMP